MLTQIKKKLDHSSPSLPVGLGAPESEALCGEPKWQLCYGLEVMSGAFESFGFFYQVILN